MRRSLILLAFALGGCCMLPSVQKAHPSGYERLVDVAPRCRDVGGMSDDYGACMNAAEILEQAKPTKATVKFLTLWDQTVWSGSFAQDASRQHDPSRGGSATGLLVTGGIQAKAVKTFAEIVVPVMATVYAGDDPYCKAMMKHLDLVEIPSRPSFDQFQVAHTQALAATP